MLKSADIDDAFDFVKVLSNFIVKLFIKLNDKRNANNAKVNILVNLMQYFFIYLL